jgi:Fur family peroxide stress response transcriptional regulator
MRKNLVQRLQQKGLKPTPQRLLIYEILAGSASHPSAEEIFAKAREQYPALSFNTVYKTLDALVRVGEVLVVETPDSKARYEVAGEAHHHFLCRRCGAIIDIHAPVIQDIVLPPEYRDGHELHGYQINFFGYCEKCKTGG